VVEVVDPNPHFSNTPALQHNRTPLAYFIRLAGETPALPGLFEGSQNLVTSGVASLKIH